MSNNASKKKETKKFATVEAQKVATIGVIVVAVLGLVGTGLNAWATYSSNKIPINATQTAEARLTEISLSATLSQTSTSQPTIASSPTLTQTIVPTPTTDQWYVRVFNVDDIGKVYVNNQEIASVNFLKSDSGYIDITSYFSPGSQVHVRFTLENKGTGYRWGFEIRRNYDILWKDEQGTFNFGANQDDHKHENQIVYDKTLLINPNGAIEELP